APQTTLVIGCVVPLGTPVHVTPSGDVITTATSNPLTSPRRPTATNPLPDQATPVSVSTDTVVPARCVHVVPSGDVSTVPRAPTATNWLAAQMTALRSSLTGADAADQVIPSIDVAIAPAGPTATNAVPDHATPVRVKVPSVGTDWLVQTVPE